MHGAHVQTGLCELIQTMHSQSSSEHLSLDPHLLSVSTQDSTGSCGQDSTHKTKAVRSRHLNQFEGWIELHDPERMTGSSFARQSSPLLEAELIGKR